MPFDHIFHEEALSEYEKQVIWYADRNIIVAEKFVAVIEASIHKICENPNIWPKKYKVFHEYYLADYPFTIIYTIHEEKNLVVISSIYHQKRNPKKKYRK